MKKFKTTSILIQELQALQAAEQEKQAELEKTRAEVIRKRSEIEKLQGLLKNNPELIEEDSEEESVARSLPQAEDIPAEEEEVPEAEQESPAPSGPPEAQQAKKSRHPIKNFSTLQI